LADGQSAVLENGSLRATVERAAGWGLTSLYDKGAARELLAAGATGNTFVVYQDQGGLYRFGNELAGCTLAPQGAAEGSPSDAQVLESGPLRVRLRAQVTLAGLSFSKEYALVAGEPFLRMTSSGSAPAGASVMVHFSLAGPIDDLLHGTPYHWTRHATGRAPWPGLGFEATHDFVVAERTGAAQAAVFHAGVPAWAAETAGLLVGALWRNAMVEQCDFYGAEGTDPDVHTALYALRVPSGIDPPESGRLAREALGFATPLRAALAGTSGPLPETLSLATASPEQAIITAAKARTVDGSGLLLRVYQPSNAPLAVDVTTAAAARFPAGHDLQVHGVSALETALGPEDERQLAIKGDGRHFSFVAPHAVTTLAIGTTTAPSGE